MNTKFAGHVTSTAFSLSLSRTSIAYLEYYVTGNYDVVQDINWPGWQALERRGLIVINRDEKGLGTGDRCVTKAGMLVFELCKEAGLISCNAKPAGTVARIAA